MEKESGGGGRFIHQFAERKEDKLSLAPPRLLSQSAMCIPPQLNPGCENSTGKLSAAEPRTKTDSPNLSYRVTEACPAATCENGHKFRGIQYNPSLFLPMIEVGVAVKYGRSTIL